MLCHPFILPHCCCKLPPTPPLILLPALPVVVVFVFVRFACGAQNAFVCLIACEERFSMENAQKKRKKNKERKNERTERAKIKSNNKTRKQEEASEENAAKNARQSQMRQRKVTFPTLPITRFFSQSPLFVLSSSALLSNSFSPSVQISKINLEFFCLALSLFPSPTLRRSLSPV